MSAARDTARDAATDAGANGRPDEDVIERVRRAQSNALQFAEPTDDRDELLRRANLALQMPEGKRIVAVVERGSDDDAEYDLRLEDGAYIAAGRARDVLDPRKMDAVLAPRTKHEPPYNTPKEHRPIGLALICAAVSDSTTGGKTEETLEWLATLGGREGLGPEIDLADQDALYHVLSEDYPMFRGSDRRLYVRVPKLFEHVTRYLGQRTTAQELRRRLARLGFTRPRNREGKIAARSAAALAARIAASASRSVIAAASFAQVIRNAPGCALSRLLPRIRQLAAGHSRSESGGENLVMLVRIVGVNEHPSGVRDYWLAAILAGRSRGPIEECNDPAANDGGERVADVDPMWLVLAARWIRLEAQPSTPHQSRS